MNNKKQKLGNTLSMIGKLTMFSGLIFGIMTFGMLNGMLIVLVGLLVNSMGSYISDGEFGLL